MPSIIAARQDPMGREWVYRGHLRQRESHHDQVVVTPLSIGDPCLQWTRERLWLLLIPVWMGLSQLLSQRFGSTLALCVMLVAHYGTQYGTLWFGRTGVGDRFSP